MNGLKFALRTLWKTPGLTIIATVSLAFGIGATTAIYSLFDQYLLRPLPVPEPSRLVNMSSPGPKSGSDHTNNAGGKEAVFSYPMFRDLERAQTVFTGIAGHFFFSTNLAYRGQTTAGQGLLVSGNYFPVLGIQAAIGRFFRPEDDRAIGQPPEVVLSYAYWQNHFQGRSDVLNDAITVNGQPLTIVGVTPPGFQGTTMGNIPDIFVPITMHDALQLGTGYFEGRRTYWVYLFARLKPGVSIEQASAAINVPYHAIINDVELPLQEGISEATAIQFRAKQIVLEPGAGGQTMVRSVARTPLILLLGATVFVLLIACANIANLLLARSASRSGEMAIRLSIGANRAQLIRQLITESCLLALFGGVAGLAVAHWTLDLIISLRPPAASNIQFGLNVPLLIFTAIVTLGTGVLFGLVPALHSTRPDILPALKSQSGQASGARSAARFRSGLATFQIALSTMLLIAAGLLTRSLYNISHVDLGLKPDRLITFSVSPRLSGYTPVRVRELLARLESDLSTLPDVSGVTVSLTPLLAGSDSGGDVSVPGFTPGPDNDSHADYNKIGPNYFHTLGIPILQGREFTDSDALGTPKVAIVNEQFAKKFNLGRDAVGKHLRLARSTEDIEIVGLAQDSKHDEVKSPAPPLFFVPYRQDDGTLAASATSWTLYVRTSSDTRNLLAAIQPAVARIDRDLPVSRLRTMEQQIENNVSSDRMITMLSVSFAALATLLAGIGLYGVLAHTVAQRTREFGVRMALGATPSNVCGLVLRQVGIMTLIGGFIGVAVALEFGDLAQSLLFEIKGNDPSVLVVSVLVLAAVAIAAGLVPAIRASRIDPMRALRYQ